MLEPVAQGETQPQDEPAGFNKKSREEFQAWIEEQTGCWEPIERPERDTVQRLIDRLQRSEE
jgi:hypothetical protein